MSRVSLQTILNSFLTRIIVGILIVGGSVALIEWAGRILLDKIPFSDEIKNLIIAIAEAAVSLYCYILLVRVYENRKIVELSKTTFSKYSLIGFASGFGLQALFILIIILSCTYSIEKINPVSYLLPSLSTALTAGFVTELIFRGILFRIAEERFGTITALSFMTLLFVAFHLNVEGATPVSVLSTAMMAGLFLSLMYVLTRSLWVPIFMHFGWDFTEPGIFGAINPGNSVPQSLFTSHISGPALITGGQLGPQNSIQALLIITLSCFIVILLVWRKRQVG